jgi:hypothetical protein
MSAHAGQILGQRRKGGCFSVVAEAEGRILQGE